MAPLHNLLLFLCFQSWLGVDSFKLLKSPVRICSKNDFRFLPCSVSSAPGELSDVIATNSNDNVAPKDAPTETKPQQPPAIRVYKPRADFNSNRAATLSSDRAYTPRSYGDQSKSSSGDFSRSYGDNAGGGRSRDFSVLLKHPQLLIRYKVPKIKSDMKTSLLELQESFRQQSESRFSQRDAGGGYGSRGGSGGGRDSFMEAFEPFAPSSFDSRRSAGKGKLSDKETERRNSEGGRQKSASNRRDKDDDDEEIENYESDSSESSGNIQDYYGDEVNVDLSVVPPDALRNMENEGYSIEEIQMALYGEYGVKASIAAIRRRIKNDNSERKAINRTGKTRRERSKAKFARQNPTAETKVTISDGPIQVSQLAEMMGVSSGEVVRHLMMNMGIMSSLNQNIDSAVAKDVVRAFGLDLANDGEDESEDQQDLVEEDESDLEIDGKLVPVLPRSPVVTIMGHVDHGKTTLLDSIRKTQVALGEAGGITQGISAFKVKTKLDRDVTFLDTPGHAAFSEMRVRGANVTDIVVLVVAADDGIMEQTKECIVAAKTANCPIVVAINKIDKEGADIQSIMTELMKYDVLVEDYGGEVQCSKISAKKGVGIEDLLEKVLLQADVMNLKAAVDKNAEGTVIEAQIDKGLGVVVTSLVQSGTLRIGDYVLAGPSWGRVRRIISDQGEDLKEATPSTPVKIVGMNSAPNAGDPFLVCEDEAAARLVAEARQRLTRMATGSMSSAVIKAQAMGFVDGSGENKELIKVPLLVKADVAGSVEALRTSLDALQISDSEAVCKVDIVYSGIGDVTSSDVAIAAVSKAKILAFNVAAGFVAQEDARASNVDIGFYNVVYDLLDEIDAKIKVTLSPPPPGKLVGRAEIKKTFRVGKVGKIAGCAVTEGLIKTDSQVRILRGKRNAIFSGTLSSLKVVKDSVSEVPSGSECGLSFTDFQDFEEGDIVECFVTGSDT